MALQTFTVDPNLVPNVPWPTAQSGTLNAWRKAVHKMLAKALGHPEEALRYVDWSEEGGEYWFRKQDGSHVMACFNPPNGLTVQDD